MANCLIDRLARIALRNTGVNLRSLSELWLWMGCRALLGWRAGLLLYRRVIIFPIESEFVYESGGRALRIRLIFVQRIQ